MSEGGTKEKRIEEIRRYFKEDLHNSFHKVRLAVREEFHTPILLEFAKIISRQKSLKGLYCATCLKHNLCTQGDRQLFSCVAYFLYHDLESEKERRFYLEYPLTEESIGKLTREQILGIFYFQQYNFLTMTSFTTSALRERLLKISQESSPYLLTT